jgi:ketose-bisphosphate aldolase
MPIHTVTALLAVSADKGWAVGQFNSHNMIMMKAALAAAAAEQAPVILAMGYQSMRYLSLTSLASAARALAEEANVPVAIHLDHARDVDLIRAALRCGFSSVMFDGCALSYADNVRITREVVAMARDAGASVEGEVGVVPQAGTRPGEISLTNIDQAAEFAECTGVDLLAVSVGSVHGMSEASLAIDQELLEKLARVISVPLVLHGASGVTDEAVQLAITRGVRKINVNTALKTASTRRMREMLAARPDVDYLELLDLGGAAITELVAHKMRVFGSSGRAGAASRLILPTAERMR